MGFYSKNGVLRRVLRKLFFQNFGRLFLKELTLKVNALKNNLKRSLGNPQHLVRQKHGLRYIFSGGGKSSFFPQAIEFSQTLHFQGKQAFPRERESYLFRHAPYLRVFLVWQCPLGMAAIAILRVLQQDASIHVRRSFSAKFRPKKRQKLFLYMTSGSLENKHFSVEPKVRLQRYGYNPVLLSWLSLLGSTSLTVLWGSLLCNQSAVEMVRFQGFSLS